MKAVGKYIVIKRIKEEIKTSSGLSMLQSQVDDMRYHKGTVISPGHEVTSVKEGDVLYYDKAGSFTLMINGESHTVVREQNVIAVE